MELKTFREISTIIERDSKDTTYKYALLRAVIDSICNYDHFISKSKNEAIIPLGLIILKWIEYYYPIFSNSEFIPQKNGDNNIRSLAFRSHFSSIIKFYKKGFDYKDLRNDILKGNLPKEIQYDFKMLVKKLRETIVKMPMHYIGSSINKGGKIFTYHYDFNYGGINQKNLDVEYLINNSGTFSIPIDYYETFKFLGSFINGVDSILYKWAEFTCKADIERKLSKEEILKILNPSIEFDREINEAKRIYEKLGKKESLKCVWTLQNIDHDLHIDHLLPFSIWGNNDLWNLLPVKGSVNISKSNKIPSLQLLEKRKDNIIVYWEAIYNEFQIRFQKEIQISLLGLNHFKPTNWQLSCFDSLVNKCEFLINQKGYEVWQPNNL
jgi:hypothetical protein